MEVLMMDSRFGTWRGNMASHEQALDETRSTVQGDQFAEHAQGVNPAEQDRQCANPGCPPEWQDVEAAKYHSDHWKEQQPGPPVRRRPPEAAEPAHDEVDQDSMPDVQSEKGHAGAGQTKILDENPAKSNLN